MNVTWTRRLEGPDARAYDAFVDAAGSAHYSQARAWETLGSSGKLAAPRYVLVRRQGEVVGAALVMVGALGPLRLPFASIERGPVATHRDLAEVLGAIHRAGRMHGAAHLRVMPYFAGNEAAEIERVLREEGFRLDHAESDAHASTLRIDLAADVLAGKEGKNLRQRVRQAEKLGVTAKNEGEAGARVLREMHDRLMRDQSMKTKPGAWFEALESFLRMHPTRGAVVVARREGAPVSCAFVVRHGTLVTWLLGATSAEHTTAYSKMVPTVMEAFAWARENGASTFDMGGIPLESDTDEKRHKIAQFKFYFAKDRVPLVRIHSRWF